MQLQSESNPALNTVTAYGEGYIEINRVSYAHPVYFAPEGEIHTWQVQAAAEITADALRTLTGLNDARPDPMAFLNGADGAGKPDDAPEVVIIGTGGRQHLLPAHVIAPLLRVGIGIEAMSTEAAARTYNILMSEGRRVLVALLPNQETA
ncbi:hypothetical protein ERD78_15155 [Allopusillimonas soli]|uniref:Xcc1710-like domain-containing protein n=1 Tax=Allopusillimonas soli TaxID=659016 RepID=A0A853FCC8_9BURK|nr:MTH938/NDUFAF3 family protein [Allopusillimonas soli]NYT38445.1 hypothetical protein [Allopusillimonas soli]TEA72000.1 hypothetical protein ERD78_15155 [Allopusillimonas soli]